MVEWKKLGDVCSFNRGRTITAKDAVDGDVPVIAGGQTPSYYHNVSNRTGESITIAGSGAYAGFVSYWNQPIYVSDAFTVDPSELLQHKYLFYWLKMNQQRIFDTQKGAGVPHVHGKDIACFQIPIPSLHEQNRIVGILDTFTASIENLKEQITQRRKQYEYYRDELLDLEGKEGVEMKILLDVLDQPITDGPHETPTFYDDGVPFISADAIVNNKIDFKRKRGYISDEYDKVCSKKYSPQLLDIYLVKSGSTTGKVAIVKTEERFNIWSPLAAIRVNKKNDPLFIFYMLQTKQVQEQVKLKSSQGSQPNLSMRVLEKFVIPVPSLDEQSRIVSILDTFEASIANLETQLKEREKQYEYYRNKLLTFE